MKYDHAKPLIKELMHIAVLYHASPGMLRTKIFDALKEFIPDMDDGCFERGCPAIDHFSSHTTTQDDELKEMVKKGTKAWADTPADWVDDLRGGAEKQEPVIPSGVINAIRNVGLTLIKTQQGYVLQRIEGIKAQTEEKKT